MRAFVTGANGFLGSHLVDRLLGNNCEVHVLVRRTSNLRWLLGKKVHYHYGDIVGEAQGLREGLRNADVCFHVAGVIHAPRPTLYYEVNAQGTANLLEACLKVNPKIGRIVVVTSIAAHGPSLTGKPATEDEECHPVTDYGQSKRDAELVVFRYADRLPITVIRPPAIYGPRDELIFQFFRLARWGVVPLLGSGPKGVNLGYVEDIVTGLTLAAEHPKAPGETFFIGDSQNYPWGAAGDILARSVRKNFVKLRIPTPLLFAAAGLSEAATRLTGKTLPLNLAQARNLVQPAWTMDISKASRLLGYRPAFDLKKGADRTAAWYFEEKWL